MSKHNKRRHLNPPRFEGTPLVGPDIESFTVGDWCPTPDGTGKPACVAMSIKLKNGMDIVMRIKTPERVDEIIQMLLRHKRSVWPEAS